MLLFCFRIYNPTVLIILNLFLIAFHHYHKSWWKCHHWNNTLSWWHLFTTISRHLWHHRTTPFLMVTQSKIYVFSFSNEAHQLFLLAVFCCVCQILQHDQTCIESNVVKNQNWFLQPWAKTINFKISCPKKIVLVTTWSIHFG